MSGARFSMMVPWPSGLGEHGADLVIDDRQQVYGLPVTAGMTRATHCLAVDSQRPPPAPAVDRSLAGEPGTHRGAWPAVLKTAHG